MFWLWVVERIEGEITEDVENAEWVVVDRVEREIHIYVTQIFAEIEWMHKARWLASGIAWENGVIIANEFYSGQIIEVDALESL